MVVLDAVATEGETRRRRRRRGRAQEGGAAAVRRRPHGARRRSGGRRPPRPRPRPRSAPSGLDAVMKLAEAASSCLAGEDPGEEAAELLEEELADAEPPPPPPVNTAYRAELPSLEAMRAAGYLEARSMTKLWAWVKGDPGDAVWPTPVATAEEALRFNACDWPDEDNAGGVADALVLDSARADDHWRVAGAPKRVTAAFEGFGR